MFKGYRALIVDGDAHSLLAISAFFKDLHIEYKRNTTGAGVREQVAQMQPDFVIMSLDLPDGDAFAIFAELAGFDVPVIAMTRGCDAQIEATLIEQGFAACIRKPLPRRDFPDMLRRILDGERVFASPLPC